MEKHSPDPAGYKPNMKVSVRRSGLCVFGNSDILDRVKPEKEDVKTLDRIELVYVPVLALRCRCRGLAVLSWGVDDIFALLWGDESRTCLAARTLLKLGVQRKGNQYFVIY